MEFTNSFLYQTQTQEAFSKLLGCDFDGKTAYNIKKIHEGLTQNFRKLGSQYDEALKLYCELDEKGNIIAPNGPGSFKIKDGQLEGWQAKVKEIMDAKFTIEKVSKIPLATLLEAPNLKLSSKDITALEPILDGLDFEL